MPRLSAFAPFLVVPLTLTVAAGCATKARSASSGASAAGTAGARKAAHQVRFRAGAHASKGFWKQWGDGNAELSGYRIVTPRYGEPRRGSVVLVYVTETMDSATWVKDDRNAAPKQRRVSVLKLNNVLRFRTGIYSYTVMASVFAPVNGLAGRERFAPVKIATSTQEWCGHVYQRLTVQRAGFHDELRSYFGGEGNRTRFVSAPRALYEDSLLVQLRELDGPFNRGKDWSGKIVPTSWKSRKAHRSLAPVSATIKRSDAKRDGAAVTRFVLAYGGYTRTFDVEKAAPRRVIYWEDSNGEKATLQKTARLPYWRLHGNQHLDTIKKLGLDR